MSTNQDLGFRINPDTGQPEAIQYVEVDRSIFEKEQKAAQKKVTAIQKEYDAAEKARAELVAQLDLSNTTLDKICDRLEAAEEALAFQDGRIETLDAVLQSSAQAPSGAAGADAPSVDASAGTEQPTPAADQPPAPAEPAADSNASQPAEAPAAAPAPGASSADDEIIPTTDSTAGSADPAAAGTPAAGPDNSGDVPAIPAAEEAAAPASPNTTSDEITIPVKQKAGF